MLNVGNLKNEKIIKKKINISPQFYQQHRNNLYYCFDDFPSYVSNIFLKK